MSLRISTTEPIAGSLLIGDTGHGVLGSQIASSGTNGPGYVYNDLSLPADANKEICGRITTWPSAGTLVAYEDTSFVFSGAPDGTYSFQYQLYIDGVATGSPATVSLQVGAVAAITSAAAWTEQPESVSAVGAIAGARTVSAAWVEGKDAIGLTATYQQPSGVGMSFTPSAARTVTVNATGPVFTVTGNYWNTSDPKKPRGSKDPNSTIDITFDWAPWLADMGDPEIASATFILAGLTDAGNFALGTKTTVFVGGGIGQQASITCRVVTASTPPRTDDRTVYLDIGDQ